MIWVKERESIGVVTPYCLGSSFPFEPFMEDAVISNNLVSPNTIFDIAEYCNMWYCMYNGMLSTLPWLQQTPYSQTSPLVSRAAKQRHLPQVDDYSWPSLPQGPRSSRSSAQHLHRQVRPRKGPRDCSQGSRYPLLLRFTDIPRRTVPPFMSRDKDQFEFNQLEINQFGSI